MTIELIYDPDCPNVTQARSNLAAALAASGLEPRWTDWNRSTTDLPPHVRRYGSPTILINGVDVAGASSGESGSCCRLYANGPNRFSGAPSVEQIVAALQSGDKSSKTDIRRASGWKSSLATLPAILAAVLPAGLCPACLPAYAGLVSAFGFGILLDAAYLFPLIALLLAIAVAALAIRAPMRHGYGPFLLGLVASAAVVSGKFVFQSDLATIGGTAALTAASIWNAWPTGESAAGDLQRACDKCD